MTDYRYPKCKRLLKPTQFKTVFNKPLFKIHQTHLMVFVYDSQLPQARLGMAITKKKVPTAVLRNKIKRIIRNQFRHHYAQLPSVDIVFILKKSTKDLTNDELREQIDNVWSALNKKYQRLLASQGEDNK